jgi:hypothetical protein
VPGGFLRSMLPIGVSAQAKNKRQRVTVGKKIGLLAHRAKQIERHHGARHNHALQQLLRLLERCRMRSGLGAPHAGFDKGRRRRG